MSYDQLIAIYFERSNALQWYWTLYVVIVGGLLAFSSIRKIPDLLTAGLVALLFCMFAFKNLGAIHDVTDQRLAVLQLIHESDSALTQPSAAAVVQARRELEPTLNPPQYEEVRNFHIASDVLTVLALLAMEHRRQRAKRIELQASPAR